MSKNVYYILFNKTFARPAGELIREILSFDKDAFFAVCTYDIDKKSFAQTMKSVQYVEVNLDESLLGSIPVPVKRWPNFIFTKYFLAWLLPKDIHKVICLEPDMVVKRDIKHLFDIKMDDYALAAAYENSGNNIERFELWDNVPLSPDKLYVNAGFNVINLDWFRENMTEDYLKKKIIDIVPFTSVYDQDFLNYFFLGKVFILPNSYNYQLRELIPWRREIRNSYIVHFSASPKPWKVGSKPSWAFLYFKFISDHKYKAKILIFGLIDVVCYPIVLAVRGLKAIGRKIFAKK